MTEILSRILSTVESARCWQEFWQGSVDGLMVAANGQASSVLPAKLAVLSGSFNPLHEGHRKLLEVAARASDKPAIFELSIANVDKPSLDEPEVLRRLEQFIDYHPIAITRAATFREKLELLPMATFILGYDTAERTLSVRYYRDELDMLSSLNAVAANGGDFLVACRLRDGELKTFDDLPIPVELREVFHEISPAEFRVDISSTELRKKV